VPSLLNLGTFGRLAQLFQRKKPRDAFLENLDEQWGNAWGTQPDASPPSRDPWLDQIASQYPFGAFDEPAAPAPAPELAMPQPAQPEPADDLAARIRASLGLGDTDEDNSLLAQVESTLRRQPYVQPPALPPAALSPTGAPPASRPPISLAPPDIATIGANVSPLPPWQAARRPAQDVHLPSEPPPAPPPPIPSGPVDMATAGANVSTLPPWAAARPPARDVRLPAPGAPPAPPPAPPMDVATVGANVSPLPPWEAARRARDQQLPPTAPAEDRLTTTETIPQLATPEGYAPPRQDVFKERLARVVQRMADEGYPVKVTSKTRTAAEQAKLYQQGRDGAPGKIVTWADGTTKISKHQTGTAADLAFVVDGRPSWDDKLPWPLLGRIAKEEGLVWGGDWSKQKNDRPHVQLEAEATQEGPYAAAKPLPPKLHGAPPPPPAAPLPTPPSPPVPVTTAEAKKDPFGFVDFIKSLYTTDGVGMVPIGGTLIPVPGLPQVTEAGAEKLPWAGAAFAAADAYQLIAAARRLRDGKATAADQALIEQYAAKEQEMAEHGTSWGYNVAQIVTEMPAFMIEMLSTEGVFTGARTAGKKAAQEAIGKLLKESAAEVMARRSTRWATKVAETAVGAAAQEAAMPTRVVAKMMDYVKPPLHPSLSPEDQRHVEAATKAYETMRGQHDHLTGVYDTVAAQLQPALDEIDTMKAQVDALRAHVNPNNPVSVAGYNAALNALNARIAQVQPQLDRLKADNGQIVDLERQMRTHSAVMDKADQKTLQDTLKEWDDDFLPALFRAIPDQFIEVFTEHAGEAIEPVAQLIGGKLAKTAVGKQVTALKTALLDDWLKLAPGNTISKWVKEIRQGAGYNGVLGEYGEERLADIMRAAMPFTRQAGEPNAAMIRMITGEPTPGAPEGESPRRSAAKEWLYQTTQELAAFAIPDVITHAAEHLPAPGQKPRAFTVPKDVTADELVDLRQRLQVARQSVRAVDDVKELDSRIAKVDTAIAAKMPPSAEGRPVREPAPAAPSGSEAAPPTAALPDTVVETLKKMGLTDPHLADLTSLQAASILSHSDRGALHDPEAAANTDPAAPRTLRSTPDSVAHAETLVETLRAGDRVTDSRGREWHVTQHPVAGGGTVTGLSARDADGPQPGAAFRDASGEWRHNPVVTAIVERGRITRGRAIPPKVTGFTTAKGSVYTVAGSGTSRAKTATGESFGPSDRTVYLDPKTAERAQLHLDNHDEGETTARPHILAGGRIGIVVKNRKTGEVRNDLSRIVRGSTTPAVGLHPFEVWTKDAEGRRRWHFGNAITEVQTDAPTAPAEKPTAVFAFHQPDEKGGALPMYHVQGGPLHRSTVSADTLREHGIDVPETPKFEGRKPATPTPADAPLGEWQPIVGLEGHRVYTSAKARSVAGRNVVYLQAESKDGKRQAFYLDVHGSTRNVDTVDAVAGGDPYGPNGEAPVWNAPTIAAAEEVARLVHWQRVHLTDASDAELDAVSARIKEIVARTEPAKTETPKPEDKPKTEAKPTKPTSEMSDAEIAQAILDRLKAKGQKVAPTTAAPETSRRAPASRPAESQSTDPKAQARAERARLIAELKKEQAQAKEKADTSSTPLKQTDEDVETPLYHAEEEAPSPKAVERMVGIVRSYLNEGITDFTAAARQFQEDYGEDARTLDAALELGWEMLTGHTVSVADALAPPTQAPEPQWRDNLPEDDAETIANDPVEVLEATLREQVQRGKRLREWEAKLVDKQAQIAKLEKIKNPTRKQQKTLVNNRKKVAEEYPRRIAEAKLDIEETWEELDRLMTGIDLADLRARVARNQIKLRTRRTFADAYEQLLNDLTPEARKNAEHHFGRATAGRDVRHLRVAMQIYELLLADDGPEGGEAEAKRLLDATNAYYADKSYLAETHEGRETEHDAFYAALHDAAVLVSGKEDFDPNDLDEWSAGDYVDPSEVGTLIFRTLDPQTASFDVDEFHRAYTDIEFRREPDSTFPPPDTSVNLLRANASGPMHTKAEGAAQIEQWKAAAQEAGRTQDNSRKIILSLYDRTGIISKPWEEAGYSVRRFDISPKADGGTAEDLTEFGNWMAEIEEMLGQGYQIVGVLAQPPCTSFTDSGNSHWDALHDTPNEEWLTRTYGEKATEFFDRPIDYANTLVAVVKLVVAQANPRFYMMENPLGRIDQQNQLPEPTLSFNPFDFGEPFSKKTQIWGEFNPQLPTFRVPGSKEEGGQGSRTWNLSSARKYEREMTPEGFAYAFFMANQAAAQEEWANQERPPYSVPPPGQKYDPTNPDPDLITTPAAFGDEEMPELTPEQAAAQRAEAIRKLKEGAGAPPASRPAESLPTTPADDGQRYVVSSKRGPTRKLGTGGVWQDTHYVTGEITATGPDWTDKRDAARPLTKAEVYQIVQGAAEPEALKITHADDASKTVTIGEVQGYVGQDDEDNAIYDPDKAWGARPAPASQPPRSRPVEKPTDAYDRAFATALKPDDPRWAPLRETGATESQILDVVREVFPEGTTSYHTHPDTGWAFEITGGMVPRVVGTAGTTGVRVSEVGRHLAVQVSRALDIPLNYEARPKAEPKGPAVQFTLDQHPFTAKVTFNRSETNPLYRAVITREGKRVHEYETVDLDDADTWLTRQLTQTVEAFNASPRVTISPADHETVKTYLQALGYNNVTQHKDGSLTVRATEGRQRLVFRATPGTVRPDTGGPSIRRDVERQAGALVVRAHNKTQASTAAFKQFEADLKQFATGRPLPSASMVRNDSREKAQPGGVIELPPTPPPSPDATPQRDIASLPRGTAPPWQMTRKAFRDDRRAYTVPKGNIFASTPEDVMSGAALKDRSRDELIAFAQYSGVPTKGSKEKLANRIQSVWRVRSFLAGQTVQTLSKYPQSDLNRMHKLTHRGKSASFAGKGGQAMSLLKWLATIRKNGLDMMADAIHELHVRKALKDGLDVPAEVLKDYPELAKEVAGGDIDSTTTGAPGSTGDQPASGAAPTGAAGTGQGPAAGGRAPLDSGPKSPAEVRFAVLSRWADGFWTDDVLPSARTHGYDGDDATLRALFDGRVASAHEYLESVRPLEAEHSGDAFIKDVIAHGGINLSYMGPRRVEEFTVVQQALAAQGYVGVRAPFRKNAGMSLDDMLVALKPKWPDLTDDWSVINKLERIGSGEEPASWGTDNFATAIRGAGVVLDEPWWQDFDGTTEFTPDAFEGTTAGRLFRERAENAADTGIPTYAEMLGEMADRADQGLPVWDNTRGAALALRHLENTEWVWWPAHTDKPVALIRLTENNDAQGDGRYYKAKILEQLAGWGTEPVMESIGHPDARFADGTISVSFPNSWGYLRAVDALTPGAVGDAASPEQTMSSADLADLIRDELVEEGKTGKDSPLPEQTAFMVGPKSHVDHDVTPAHLAFAQQHFAGRTAFFAETVTLPDDLPALPSALYGPIAGDPPVPDADVFQAKRGDRAWDSRLIDRPSRPSRKLTVIAGPNADGQMVLYTAFGGELAPQEPGDPGARDKAASEQFWSEHALSAPAFNVTPPEPEGEPRAPWQMTPEEWAAHEAKAFGDAPKPVTDRTRGWHRGQVLDAVKAGKPVPARVLALYPEAAPDAAPDVITFRSGNQTSPTDIAGYIRAGKAVGVVAFANPKVRAQAVEYAQHGGPVFVDSGAFGHTVVENGVARSTLDFDAVLDYYIELLVDIGEAHAGNVWVVAPDVAPAMVDGQMRTFPQETRDLQKQYRARVQALIDTGANVIAPVQVDESRFVADVIDTVADFPGAQLGLPGNKGAVPVDVLAEAMAALTTTHLGEDFRGVHFLGVGDVGTAKAKLQYYVDTVRADFPDALITSDATRTTAMIGEGRVLTEGARKQLRMLGGFAADEEVVDYDLDSGVAGQFFRGEWDKFTPQELQRVFDAAGLTREAAEQLRAEGRINEIFDWKGYQQWMRDKIETPADQELPEPPNPAFVTPETDPSVYPPVVDTLMDIVSDRETAKPTTRLQAREDAIAHIEMDAQTPEERARGDAIRKLKETQAAAAPAVDVLDTGEQQPRLPGDVGEVRTQETATPEFDAPFSLTSEIGKTKPQKPDTLFQDPDEERIPTATEIKLMVDIVDSYPKTMPFEEAVRSFAAEFGDGFAGKLHTAFEKAWKFRRREVKKVEDVLSARKPAPPKKEEEPAPPPRPPQPPPPPAPPPSLPPGLAALADRPLGVGQKHRTTLVKDLFSKDPGYVDWLVGLDRPSELFKQVREYYTKYRPDYLKYVRDREAATKEPAPETPPAPPVDPASVLTPDNLAVLRRAGVTAEAGPDGTILLKGRTYAYKDLIRSAGGRSAPRGDDGRFTGWLIPANRLAELVGRLGDRRSNGQGSGQRRASYESHPELADLRRRADEWPDASDLPGDRASVLSPGTAAVITKGGLAIGIPQFVLDEQIEDVARISHAYQKQLPAFILASEPGSGKTFVLGGAMRELRRQGAKKIVYVTLNNDLVSQIRNDLAAFAIGDVQFITYDKLRKTEPFAVDAIIFDEAQKIKNVEEGGSAVAIAAQGWVDEAKFTIYASATPAENPVQMEYIATTGLLKPLVGDEFWKFAAAFGATPLRRKDGAGNIYYDIEWRRTLTSDADAAAAREWLRKQGVYTSRRIRLPDGQVDSRNVKIDVPEVHERRYTQISQAVAAMGPDGNAKMWVINFQKRLLEAAKVQQAITEARSALDRGRFPIIFVETKAERRIDIPDLMQRERDYALAVGMAKAMGDSKPRRKEFGLPPAGVTEVLEHYMNASGESVIEIPPAVDEVRKALGAENVAEYTGDVSGKQAAANLAEWRAGGRKVLVATMAKGGTGLSLHDKVGDHQTTQININMPWTATSLVQVAQRSARYGLKGRAEIMWLFAHNIPFDRALARRVGGRMADLGAIVHGEALPGSEQIENWDFEDESFADEEVKRVTAEMNREAGNVALEQGEVPDDIAREAEPARWTGENIASILNIPRDQGDAIAALTQFAGLDLPSFPGILLVKGGIPGSGALTHQLTVDRVRTRFRRAPLVSVNDAVRALGGGVPGYLDAVADFLRTQREKVVNGELTTRDVAKAYLLTLGSIGAGPINLDTFVKSTGLVPSADFVTVERGVAKVRPEEAVALWMFTPAGQRALDALEGGHVRQRDFAGLMRVRDAYGRNDIRNNGFRRSTTGLRSLYDIKTLTDELNAARGASGPMGEIVRSMMGISHGKEGFIKHLLGIGDTPTVDSVAINFWLTGQGDIRDVQTPAAQLARDVKTVLLPKDYARAELADRIQQQVQAVATRLGMDPETAGHLLHHWLWDKARGTETSHAGMMRAMAMAQEEQAGLKLSVLHNLHVDNLGYVDQLGGLPVPSLGIVSEGGTLSGMGNITLIGRRALADPERDPVFDADAYTQTFPRAAYPKAKTGPAQRVLDRFKPFATKFDDKHVEYLLWDNAVNTPNPHDTISRLLRSEAGKAWYLSEVMGKTIEPTMKPRELRAPWVADPTFVAEAPELMRQIDALAPSERTGDSAPARAFAALARGAIDRYLETPEGAKWVKVNKTREAARAFVARGWGDGGEWMADESQTIPWGTMSRLVDSVRQDVGKERVDGEKTRAELDAALKGKEAEFKAWIEQQVLGLHGEPYITIGRRRVPITLSNLVDAMRAGAKVNSVQSTLVFGEGKARASAAHQITSTAELRNRAAWQLGTEESIKAARETAKKALEEWRNDVVRYYGERTGRGEFGQTWEGLDASMRALARWASTKGRTAQTLRSALWREGFRNVPGGAIADGVKAGRLFMEAPVPYFEAKPQRAVRLSEFAGAVIPSTAPAETRAILDKHGVPYREYDAAQEKGQQEATIAFRDELARQGEDVLFQRNEQTESAAFQRWFGNSEVVDAAGDPLVVYHGTGGPAIAAFEGGRVNTRGIYFTASPHLADAYASRPSRGGRQAIYPVYLRIENPFVVERQTPDQVRADRAGATERRQFSMSLSAAQIADLKAQGYDGIINHDAKEYVVFDPAQIKSAIGNRGTFDPSDPNILYQGDDEKAPTLDELTAQIATLQQRLDLYYEKRAPQAVIDRAEGQLAALEDRAEGLSEALGEYDRDNEDEVGAVSLEQDFAGIYDRYFINPPAHVRAQSEEEIRTDALAALRGALISASFIGTNEPMRAVDHVTDEMVLAAAEDAYWHQIHLRQRLRIRQANGGDAMSPALQAYLAEHSEPLYESAWHGSPHIFEKFSLHHVGTGEGAQTFGWGLYFAGKREVAEGYRHRLAGPAPQTPHLALRGEPVFRPNGTLSFQTSQITTRGAERVTVQTNPITAREHRGWKELEWWAGSLAHYGHTPATGPEAVAVIRQQLEATEREYLAAVHENSTISGDAYEDADRLANVDAAIDLLDQHQAELDVVLPAQPGRLYKVEIPEDEDFLDWDKTASQQSQKVQTALRALGIEWEPVKPWSPKRFLAWSHTGAFDRLWREDIGIRESLAAGVHAANSGSREAFDRWYSQHQGLMPKGMIDPTGATLYGDLQNQLYREKGYASTPGSPMYKHAARLASEALAAQGIAGIRYLDGASRSKGEGTSNFVVFDDKLVNIVEMYQEEQRRAKASVEFLDTGEALVRALTNPDVSSGVHELAHIARRWLFDLSVPAEQRAGISDDDIRTAAKWAGARIGPDGAIQWRWTRRDDQGRVMRDAEGRLIIDVRAEEKFARGFERYLYEGKAPIPELEALFQKFAAWLRDIYHRLLGSPIDVEISPAMWEVYDHLVTRMATRTDATADRASPADTEPLDALFQLEPDDPPPTGFWAKRRAAREERNAPPLITSLDPAVEERLRAARGHPVTPWLAGMKEKLGVLPKLTRHFPEISPSRSAPEATAHELLLEQERASKFGQVVAYNRISDLLAPMTLREVDVFTRALILPDILKDVEDGLYEGKELPFGFADADAVEADLARVNAVVAEHPKIRTALDKRAAFVKRLTQDLVTAKLLKREVLDDDRYYHRQVMAHLGQSPYGLGVANGKQLRARRRGFQVARTGGDDFNTAYHEAEFEWVSQAVAELKTHGSLAALKQLFDKTPDLKLLAKQQNRRLLGEKLAIAGGVNASDPHFPAMARVYADEALKPYRQRMARATYGLLDALYAGNYDPPAQFTDVIDDLMERYTEWKDENAKLPVADRTPFDASHPQWWPLMKALAQGGDSEAAIWARSMFKTTIDREAYIERVLGHAYINRLSPESLARLLPDGYTLWQPKPGNRLYPAVAVDERVLNAVIEGTRELRESDKKKIQALGGPKETWIVPEWLAQTLDQFTLDTGSSNPMLRAADEALRTALGLWKVSVLIGPTRAFKYNLNNATGDVDAAAAFSPGVAAHVPSAAAFLYRTTYAHDRALAPADAARIERLTELGIMDAGLTAAEIPHINDLAGFRWLAEANPISFMQRLVSFTGVPAYIRIVQQATNYRENILRVASYDHMLKQIKAGKTIYGASNPARVDALRAEVTRAQGPVAVARAQERLAALLARDLIGDYQAVSTFTRTTRSRVLPFFSFQEINMKRYFRLLSNVRREEGSVAGKVGRVLSLGGRGVVRGGVKAAVTLGLQAAIVNAFIVAVSLWNKLLFPDEDQELRDQGRQQLHIIWGRDDDGLIRTWRVEGAFSALLSWGGLQNWINDAHDVIAGDVAIADKLADTAWAVPNKAWQMWDPFSKMAYELLTGRQTYPDIRRPRPIRDKAEHAASLFALDWLWQEVTGKPAPPHKWTTRFLFYRTDPGEAAYFDIRGRLATWKATQPGGERGPGDPSAQENALYYYHRAVQWGDDDAAERWLEAYYERGGTPKGIKQSEARGSPLGSLSEKDQKAFMAELTDKEQETLAIAEDWYAGLYGPKTVRHKRAQ